MGLFSSLKRSVRSPFASPGISGPIAGLGGFGVGEKFRDLTGGKEAREAADARITQARAAGDLQREFADILRADIAPLREFRDENLTGLLDLIRGGGGFEDSQEFRSVLDAATGAIPEGVSGGLRSALTDRARGLASGQFNTFANRIGTQAGVGARGLNTTNALLQQNVTNQAGLLQRAGELAAGGILGQSAQRSQTLGGIASLGASIFSDVRLKKNITKIGTLRNGLNVYEWDWKEEKYNVFPTKGLIAQEVEKTNPEAVFFDEDGLMHVDLFKATGVPMEALNAA